MSYERIVTVYYKDSRQSGVNALDYLQFLRLLPNGEDDIYFHDNARLHKDSLIENYIRSNDLLFISNVQYSSDFMAIESVFNIVKGEIRKLSYLNQNNARGLFMNICYHISRRVVTNIVDATYRRYTHVPQ